MPAYGQREVSALPEGWQIKPLSDVSWFQEGPGVRNWQFTSSGIKLLNGTNIFRGKLDLTTTTRFISTTEANGTYAHFLADEGDIVIASSGIAIDRLDEKVAFVRRDNLPFCMNTSTIRFKAKEVFLDPKYLFHFLRSDAFKLQIGNQATGSAQLNFGPSHVKNVLTPIPSIAEQRAISSTLSDADALLGALDRLIAKKRDLKQAAMQQLLTGQTRLPGFAGEWDDVLVADVIVTSFCGPSPTCEERNIGDESEWGVLKTTAATVDRGWNWRAHKLLPRAFWHQRHIELRKGDVIVTKAGPRHRVGVAVWIDFVPPRVIPSGKMIALRPNPKRAVPLLLASAISAPAAQIFLDQRTTGMAESQVNFENGALLETPIRLPKIEEQMAIATVLTDMDAELEALEQRRVKTVALKQGMMQELLTGRTRLV